MGLHLSQIFAFLILTLVVRASHVGALPLPHQQVYWNSVLPGTPMPKALSELVQPGSAKNFDGYDKHAEAPKQLLKDQYAAEDELLVFYNHGAPKQQLLKDQHEAEDKLLVFYNHGATTAANQLLHDPTQVVFFLEKDLQPGTTMKYSLARNTNRATFLPRKAAEKIPFSSVKLPEILNQFSVKPGSAEAGIVKETIQTCEGEVLKGEDRYCATSLESMVDFAKSKLGRNVQAISTEVEKGATLQNYTVKPGVKKVSEGDQLIVCHKMTYAYAVFYCHTFGKSRAYVVPLQGADGTSAKAVAVCHVDTSEWNPHNFALQVLKVKPGTVPVCHFLPQGHIAWVPN